MLGETGKGLKPSSPGLRRGFEREWGEGEGVLHETFVGLREGPSAPPLPLPSPSLLLLPPHLSWSLPSPPLPPSPSLTPLRPALSPLSSLLPLSIKAPNFLHPLSLLTPSTKKLPQKNLSKPFRKTSAKKKTITEKKTWQKKPSKPPSSLFFQSRPFNVLRMPATSAGRHSLLLPPTGPSCFDAALSEGSQTPLRCFQTPLGETASHEKGRELRDKTLKTNRLGLSWTDNGSKFSLTVKRRFESSNSRPIMTKEEKIE